MPIDNTAQYLIDVVTTTKSKYELLNEIAAMQTELSKTILFDYKNIQDYYPTLCKILQNMAKSLDNKISQNLPEFLDKLKKQVEGLSELNFYLPLALFHNISQNEQIKQEVVLWARDNVDARVIVDFQTKEDFTTGFVCSYNGRYKDITLDKILRKRIYDEI